MRVAILLADDFTLSAFALFVDHIRLAADEGDRSRQERARWSVFSATGGEVRSSCGLAVGAATTFGDAGDFDYVVLVGGLLRHEQRIGATAADFVRRQAAAGAILVGLCTGVFILCRLGLMAGRRCCVSWYHLADFAAEFPDHRAVADRLYIVDGPRVSCAGGAGTADLAVELIRRHLGEGPAQKASQVLLFPRPRDGDENQPHPPVSQVAAGAKVSRALLLMEQNIAQPLPIATVAARLHVSARQLERLFRAELGAGPAVVYRDVRLRYAGWLLATTDRSVTAIAYEAGFADAAHLARHYRAAHGRSPSEGRAAAGVSEGGGELAASRLFDA